MACPEGFAPCIYFPCFAIPPPAQTLSISGEELLVYLAFSCSSYGMSEFWLHFDATFKVQEQYALRLVAAFYIVLIFNTVKPEFPGY